MLTFRRWSIIPSPLLFTFDLSLIFHVCLHITELGFSALLSLSLSLIICLLLCFSFSTTFFNYHLLPFTNTWSSCTLVFTLAFYNLFQVPLLITEFQLLDLNLPCIFPLVFFLIVQVSLITKFLLPLHPVGSLVLFFSLPFSELSCIFTRIFLLIGKYCMIFILSSHNCDRFFLQSSVLSFQPVPHQFRLFPHLHCVPLYFLFSCHFVLAKKLNMTTKPFMSANGNRTHHWMNWAPFHICVSVKCFKSQKTSEIAAMQFQCTTPCHFEWAIYLIPANFDKMDIL